MTKSEFDAMTDHAIANELRRAKPDSDIRALADAAGWQGLTPPPHPDGHEWDSARRNWILPPPPPEPAPVPLTLTPRQIRLALRRLYSITPAIVDAVLTTLPEPQRTDAQIEWEYATRIERTHPMIDLLAAELTKATGKTVDADEVFIFGGNLGGEGA